MCVNIALLLHQCILLHFFSPGLSFVVLFHIYIYAFSTHFYPKQRTVHSGYTFSYQYVCSTTYWIEPTTCCAANAMLYHWATGTLFIFSFIVSARWFESRNHFMNNSVQIIRILSLSLFFLVHERCTYSRYREPNETHLLLLVWGCTLLTKIILN